VFEQSLTSDAASQKKGKDSVGKGTRKKKLVNLTQINVLILSKVSGTEQVSKFSVRI
jgi:hypothetical protein